MIRLGGQDSPPDAPRDTISPARPKQRPEIALSGRPARSGPSNFHRVMLRGARSRPGRLCGARYDDVSKVTGNRMSRRCS